MNNFNIGVLGVGYVGLPLVKSLSKNFKIVAYDPNKKRINSLIVIGQIIDHILMNIK